MGQRLRAPRRATWRRGRSTGRAPSACDELLGARRLAGQHLGRLRRRRRRSATAARRANSASSGVSGARTATATSAVGQPARRPSSVASLQPRAERLLGARARARRRRPSRAPPRAGAAARAARTRGTRRAAASGRAALETNSARSSSSGMSRLAVASCLEMRASSACSVRFCLRLAPLISSTWSSTASSEPNRCSSSAAVLSPIPGTPGMLSLVSPFSPMKSGTSSGGIAVAVDHALAVVDARVGDAAARWS